MSNTKIKSKDLSYEATLPPFLQRLHAQKAGRTGDTDRHEQQVARPKRVKTADEDDGPTVVDESGEVVGKEEFERMNEGDEVGSGDVEGEVGGETEGGDVLKQVQNGEWKRGGEQKFTDGTGVSTKKRKVGKVVGEEEETEDARTATIEKSEKPAKKAVKKKSKPIKLAFADEDDET